MTEDQSRKLADIEQHIVNAAYNLATATTSEDRARVVDRIIALTKAHYAIIEEATR